jgi:hypothetical protein
MYARVYIYGSQEVYIRLALASFSATVVYIVKTGACKFDFCIPPQSTPLYTPSTRPAVGALRDPALASAIITSEAEGAAKCLTRCSKLHLIQRPRLAKWHIVRGASINGSPLHRLGGMPFSTNKNTFRVCDIHTLLVARYLHVDSRSPETRFSDGTVVECIGGGVQE